MVEFCQEQASSSRRQRATTIESPADHHWQIICPCCDGCEDGEYRGGNGVGRDIASETALRSASS